MVLKKSALETLFAATKGTEGILNLSESRLRDSFIKPLQETTLTFTKEREDIYKKFCIKKEDGTPDLLKGTNYQFTPEVQEELVKELEVILNEEVEVSFPLNIKEVLEKTEYKPKVGEVEILDEILAKL